MAILDQAISWYKPQFVFQCRIRAVIMTMMIKIHEPYGAWRRNMRFWRCYSRSLQSMGKASANIHIFLNQHQSVLYDEFGIMRWLRGRCWGWLLGWVCMHLEMFHLSIITSMPRPRCVSPHPSTRPYIERDIASL